MDDNFKKQLVGILDEYFDRKFIIMFNQGFEEVVLPEIERLDEKIDRVENKLGDVENRVGSLEIRIGQMDNKLDLMNDKPLDHGGRLKKLERAPSVAHQIRK